MHVHLRLALAGLAFMFQVSPASTATEEVTPPEPTCGRPFSGAAWEWAERWGPSPPSCNPAADIDSGGTPDQWVAFEPPADAIGRNHFKVWFVHGHAEAEDAAPWILDLFGTHHNPVEELFGRRIPSDLDCPCNGGDGRTDIYLLPPEKAFAVATQAIGFPVADRCSQPSYFKLRHEYLACGPDLLAPLVVHELTHMLQYSYDLAPPCAYESVTVDRDLSMWIEGSAVWGQWALLGGNPTLPKFSFGTCLANEPFADRFLHQQIRDPLHENPYESFVFAFFLSTRYDAIVPKVWESIEEGATTNRLTGALERSVDVFAGTDAWGDTWAHFSAANLNLPPVDDYARHDIRTEGEREAVSLTATSGTTIVPLPSSEVRPLAAHLYEVAVDDSVRTLLFETGLGDEPPNTLRLQALPLVRGERTLEDWTYAETVTYCRDRPNEDVGNLLLVVSNGDWSIGAQPVRLDHARWIASPLPCSPWRGTLHFRSESSAVIGDFGSGRELHEATATLRFESLGTDHTGEGIVSFFVGRGSLDYTWSGEVRLGDRSATCGGDRQGVPAQAVLQLREHLDGRRDYQLAGYTEIEGPIGTGCDGSQVEGAAIPFVDTGWRPLESFDEIGGEDRVDIDDANNVVRSWTLAVDEAAGAADP